MADKTYRLIFHKDDGTEESVEFTAPQGPKGDPGNPDGSSIYHIGYATEYDPEIASYLVDLKDFDNPATVKPGDLLIFTNGTIGKVDTINIEQSSQSTGELRGSAEYSIIGNISVKNEEAQQILANKTAIEKINESYLTEFHAGFSLTTTIDSDDHETIVEPLVPTAEKPYMWLWISYKRVIGGIEHYILPTPALVGVFNGSTNDFTETDPTVPAWAKKSTKPAYGASEISYDPGEVGGSSAEATNVESALRGHREWLASLEETMIDCVKVFRRINGKTLESDIELTAADVGAVPNTQKLTITGVDANGASHSWTVYGVTT